MGAQPDWRDAGAYAPLLEADRSILAWEWLRRDAAYRAAAARRVRKNPPGTPAVIVADETARSWGLHVFEDPDRPAPLARPLWRREADPRVLVAHADPGGEPGDCFDLGRFAGLATIARSEASEHILIGDGLASLRIDLESGTLLAGPVRLAYRLRGLAEVAVPLGTLRRLLRLWETESLEPAGARARNQRLILLLRTHDALQAGATQRDIAAELLGRVPPERRWRTRDPSLRLRAQRLVRGARAMAAGGYRSLLQPELRFESLGNELDAAGIH